MPPPITNLSVSGFGTSLKGLAPAGATIEAIDLTLGSKDRKAIDQYTTIATADANGSFDVATLAALPGVKEGDFVRLHAKKADGSDAGTITVRISGLSGKDDSNAPFVDRRLALYDDGTGKAAILWNPYEKRPSSEPFAQFKLSNVRTGAETIVKLDADGYLPADFSLAGVAGDEFKVAVSDGVNNADFKIWESARLTVAGKLPHANDVADPGAYSDNLDKKGRTTVGMKLYSGPLFIDGVKPEDVQQRYIGDCYLPSAVGSIAKLRPAELTKIFAKNADGSYTITFKEYDSAKKKWVDKPIKVDADLYVDTAGGLIYGASIPDASATTMELWWPLLEKAYAQWKGSYDKIGHGGHAEQVMAAILGRQGVQTTPNSVEDMWKQAKASLDKSLPCSLGTPNDSKRYENTGVHENHSYSVLGYEIDATTKQRFLIMRNPWGNSEPGNDGQDDGIFKITIEDAYKYFDTFHTVK